MGTFRIEIEAVGGHGCQRERKDGEVLQGCGLDSCPDCIVARTVCELQRNQTSINHARIVHWPGQPSEVVDEFDVKREDWRTRAPRTRKGSF